MKLTPESARLVYMVSEPAFVPVDQVFAADTMVCCMEGDRPGLCGPSSLPASRGSLGKGQHVGQAFPALDGDSFGLDRRIEAKGVRNRYRRYAV